MDVGYVTNVYATEGDPRADRDGSIEEALHDGYGGCIVGAEGGAEDADGVDDGELESIAFACDEIPGGALGESLRLGVSSDAGAAEIRPVPLIEGRSARLLTIADGDEGRGEDDPLDASVAGGAENAEGAVAGGDDELVLMLWSSCREW